ncbi:MAG: N-acetylglucosamine kinase [Formosa sp.]|jgi:N-acetylglucosamine kinase-like BadF-type ATPase|nr:N-acetylglucosamine kinase [Formosa sp.]MDA9640149.1 N-acetylglucosamine kinase [Flavobacteriaceae bacterium]MDC0463685.1 N-acetylglucosamine kinase [Flavobacteriaceae bacterium]|tara:strand:- start:3095 stop:3967 length:873 start_codon:yes stop_codon:yes gene_type:complete
MIFVIDSGSTKCDWIAIDPSTGKQLFEKQRTKGLNPAIISDSDAFNIIKANNIIYENKLNVTHIYFYGAGCGTEKPVKMLKGVLQSIFINAQVVVKEDTYAAVYATVGVSHSPAVVCILGTGSNCSYYDGQSIDQKIVSLGYSVMDDASGNYYGRQLLRDYYFDHMPHDLKLVFKTRYNVSDDVIKSNLYKKANPNAYLATFAEFLILNKESEYVQKVIKEGMRIFVKNMILQYSEEIKTVPVHFAGSIAYFTQDEIKEVAREYGFTVGNFQRRPIEGLVEYHVQIAKTS